MDRKVTIIAFKKPRCQSALMHTGILIRVDSSLNSKYYIHEVSGGLGGYGAKSKVVIRNMRKDEKFEETHIITSFYSKSKIIQKLLQQMLPYSWKYNIVFNNCRDHILYVIDRIEKSGYTIADGARKWVETIKTNDFIIVTTLAYIGYLIYNATKSYSNNKLIS